MFNVGDWVKLTAIARTQAHTVYGESLDQRARIVELLDDQGFPSVVYLDRRIGGQRYWSIEELEPGICRSRDINKLNAES